MTQTGALRKVFESDYLDETFKRNHRKNVNLCPEDIADLSTPETTIFKDHREHITFTQQYLTVPFEDRSDVSNIVFLGIHGADKHILVNHLFNQEIEAPLTKVSRYIEGEYLNSKIRVASMIDLCGEHIEPDQLENVIADSLKANLSEIDTVVFVTSGRFQYHHNFALKRFLTWLDFKQHQDNFVFIHRESLSSISPGQKNVKFVMESVGAKSSRSLSLNKLQSRSPFKEAEEELKLFIKTVLHREPTKLSVAGIFPPSKIASQTSSMIYTKRDVHVQKTPSAFKRKMRETDDTQSLESKRERVDVSQLSEKMDSMDLTTNNK